MENGIKPVMYILDKGNYALMFLVFWGILDVDHFFYSRKQKIGQA